MADEGTEDTFETTIAGRLMTFKKSSEGQLMALQRVINRLNAQFRAATEASDRRELATKIGETVLNVAESRFLNQEDRDWVEEQMLLGKIDIPDIMMIFANGAVREDPLPDDAPPPKKTATKRSPKAAPVKKTTANASRTRR